MEYVEATQWLFQNGGPILRWRMAVEGMVDLPQPDREQGLRDCLDAPETRRWIGNLARSRQIHGSQDTAAENPLAKLLDFGLGRGVPEFDEVLHPFMENVAHTWVDSFILYPFMVRAGYASLPWVAARLAEHVEALYQTALDGDFDFFLDTQQAAGVPKAWQGKPIYKDRFGHEGGYALPTCYDFYALAYCPAVPWITDLDRKLESIVGFLSNPRFQATPGGYGWARSRKRCYAAGRVFLACAEAGRMVLFLELGARFAAVRRAAWFQDGLAQLEASRTQRGTYRFPPELMLEKPGYQIYGGSHMGLGENRRLPQALELESTFHMLYIQKRMQVPAAAGLTE